MPYLTYEEYTSYGGSAPEASFTPLEFKCRKRLDYLTDNRIAEHMAEIPEDVKLCMVSMINMENAAGAEAQATQPQVTSFNTDGYSETYGHALSAEDSSRAMNQMVKTMLWGVKDDTGTPVLYRGVKQA